VASNINSSASRSDHNGAFVPRSTTDNGDVVTGKKPDPLIRSRAREKNPSLSLPGAGSGRITPHRRPIASSIFDASTGLAVGSNGSGTRMIARANFLAENGSYEKTVDCGDCLSAAESEREEPRDIQTEFATRSSRRWLVVSPAMFSRMREHDIPNRVQSARH